MRRLLGSLLILPLIAACAKSDTATPDTARAVPPVVAAAAPGAKFVGSWMVHAVTTGAPAKDTGVTFMATTDASGNTMQPMGKDTVRYHRMSVTDSTFVMESAPYRNPTMKAEVTEHVDGKMMGDSMGGTWQAKPTDPKVKAMSGAWTAHKVP